MFLVPDIFKLFTGRNTGSVSWPQHFVLVLFRKNLRNLSTMCLTFVHINLICAIEYTNNSADYVTFGALIFPLLLYLVYYFSECLFSSQPGHYFNFLSQLGNLLVFFLFDTSLNISVQFECDFCIACLDKMLRTDWLR